MSNWPKANPMFDETTPYAKRLLARTKADYDDLGLETIRQTGIYDQADESARSRHRKRCHHS